MPANSVQVTVWFNDPLLSMFLRFDEASNAMMPVFTWSVPCDRPDDLVVVERLADDVFRLTNVDWDSLTEPRDRALARQYRVGNRLRSTSAGDVVQIGAHFLAVEHAGWRWITEGMLNVVSSWDSPWHGDRVIESRVG
jgi:hypothetical protein